MANSASAPTHLRGTLELTLALGTLLLMGAAAFALLKYHTESLALALAAGGSLLALGAVLLHWPALQDFLRRPVWGPATVGLIATWAVWGVLAAVTVALYASEGWDESDYYLSGMFLRGYPTHYSASRPPVTHWIAAVFTDLPQMASAAQIALLVLLLSVWCIRRWGWKTAALPLALLATQNVVIERFFGFTSELPATLILAAAYFSLSRKQFAFSGLLFAFATLSRWNLAVIPVAVGIGLLVQFGWKPATRFVVGGAAVAAVFLTLSFLFVPHPIRQIVEGNFVPAIAWAEVGAARPDFFSRSRFYFGHAFFLTPLALLAVVQCLRTWRRGAAGSADDWCIRCAIPVGFIAYGLLMLTIGAHFPRFMTPIVPLAILVLTDFLVGLPNPWRVAAACFTAAWGLWPADSVLLIQKRLAHRPAFSPAFSAAVAREVPATGKLCAPAVQPLTVSGGLPPMVDLRRELFFPSAKSNDNGDLLVASSPAEAVQGMLQAAPPGAYFLIPAEQERLPQGGRVLARDERWVLWVEEGR